MAVTTFRVVEHLDVIEDIALEQLKEALRDGVVVAATSTTHARDKHIRFQEGRTVMPLYRLPYTEHTITDDRSEAGLPH